MYFGREAFQFNLIVPSRAFRLDNVLRGTVALEVNSMCVAGSAVTLAQVQALKSHLLPGFAKGH